MESKKLFYSISEVAKLIELPLSTIRYWEKKFKILNPKRAGNKRRTYTQKDIETLNSIRTLLYEENYKIKGAKNKLKNNPSNKMSTQSLDAIESVLKEVIKILES
ncbi:MAG: MerR family transcriptional regulator [bacterium]|nr:MerR family transcriptional regulator [bacterium]